MQLKLDSIIAQLPPRVRLLELKWIERTFDLTEDEARALIDDGSLRFAFHVGDATARRAEIRVWRGSAACYAAREEDTTPLAEVIRQCLPAGEVFQLSQLWRPWAVKSTHLNDLLRQGELEAVPGQTLHATQSPLITRASASRFLERRKL